MMIIKVVESNLYKNKFLSYLLKLSLCADSSTWVRYNLWKKIMLVWLHLLLLRPFARLHRARIKTTNQSQKEYLTACPAPHCRQRPCPSAHSHLQRADTMADKQPPKNRLHSLHDEDKLTGEDQWPGLWRRAGVQRREGEGPGGCTRSNFRAKSTLFSVLPTATLRLQRQNKF